MGDVIQQDLRLRHLPAAHRLAGQQAAGGGDDLKAILFQGGDVVLGDGVFQHGRVHGRGDQLLALGRQDHGGQHVIRQAVGQLGDHICGCRGDQHQIRRVGQRNMGHIILEVAVKGIHNAAVVGQGFKHQRGDKLRGVFGHQHMHIGAGFGQGMGHIGHFISSNPAGNAQHNGFAFQVHDNTSLYLAGLLAARIVLLLSISCRGAKVKAIPHNSKCRYGERGAADAVPQLPERCLSRKAGIVRCCLKGIQQLANGLRTAIINCNFTFCAFYTFITGQLCIILRQYRTILSTAPAGIVRCCPKPIERETLPGCQGYEVLPYDSCS